MGLTTRLLRDWMRAKRKAALAELNPPTPAVSLADLPAPGQRWKRNPDGSWLRWSYLGEEWEPQEAPQTLIDAATLNLAVNEWTREQDGSWSPTNGDKNEATDTSSAEQAVPPLNPEPSEKPRPEWSSDWKPEWKEPFK